MSSRRHRHRREPIPVSDRIGRFRGGSGAPDPELVALQGAWPGIGGPQVAGNSTVVRRSRAGVVTVACASAIWAQELRARADLLADQLRRAAPDVVVTGIRFVVGDHAVPAVEPPRSSSRVRPTPKELADAEAIVGEVSDPDLRALLTRAAAGQMAVARTRRKSLQNRAKEGRDARQR